MTDKQPPNLRSVVPVQSCVDCMQCCRDHENPLLFRCLAYDCQVHGLTICDDFKEWTDEID